MPVTRQLLAAVAAAALFALPAAAQTVIKVGTSLPQNEWNAGESDPVNGMYEMFKSEVETNTNGDIIVEIAYGHSLGNPDERLAQARQGIIQMTDAGDAQYANVYPDANVFTWPYLFPTEEIAWQVFDGPIGQEMATGIRDQVGIHVFGYWTSGGFKHYSSNKEIREPADLDGQKLRVLGPLFALPVETLGGSPTVIPFPELYTSLKTGVVDGQDNAVWVFNIVKLYEVQKFLILSGHIYAWGILGINADFFDGLPAAQQTILEEAATKALAWNRSSSQALEARSVAFAQENGVEVIEIEPAAKIQFQEQVRPAAAEWLRDNIANPELVDRVLAEVESLS